jgi:hypothetical protein
MKAIFLATVMALAPAAAVAADKEDTIRAAGGLMAYNNACSKLSDEALAGLYFFAKVQGVDMERSSIKQDVLVEAVKLTTLIEKSPAKKETFCAGAKAFADAMEKMGANLPR